MRKKVLLLALALVVAFAGSALAAVEFSGDFTATLESKKFNFEDGVALTPGLKVNIKATNESVTAVEGEEEEVTNWDFSAGLSLEDSKFELDKYKLGLYDNYFKAWVWGNGQDLSDKETPFGFVSAGKKAANVRARVEVPVLDLAKVTLDFDPNDNLRAFVEGEVEGFTVGLAYAGLKLSSDADHALVVHGGGDIEDLGVEAAAGVKLGDDLGLALGLGVEYAVTEELEVDGSVVYKNEYWAEEVTTVLKAGATYTEDEFQASVNGKLTLKDENENEVSLGAKYRMSDTVAHKDLFHKDHWYKNDAPAFGVSAKFADLKFDNVRVDAASPVVDGLAWVKAYGEFKNKDEFGAGLLGHILASDKLTVKPSVDYENPGSVVDAKLAADYKIGLSDTVLSLLVQKVFTEEGHVDDDGELVAQELIKASVKVPF